MRNFIEAFELAGSSNSEICSCGKIYYDVSDMNDFEEGELESYENNPKAVACDHSIGLLVFEGKEYVQNCGCWKFRANQIMDFIDSHNSGIAAYLNNERKRKIAEAEAIPVVSIK